MGFVLVPNRDEGETDHFGGASMSELKLRPPKKGMAEPNSKKTSSRKQVPRRDTIRDPPASGEASAKGAHPVADEFPRAAGRWVR